MIDFGWTRVEKSAFFGSPALSPLPSPTSGAQTRRRHTKISKSVGQGQNSGVGRSDPGLAEPAPPNLRSPFVWRTGSLRPTLRFIKRAIAR